MRSDDRNSPQDKLGVQCQEVIDHRAYRRRVLKGVKVTFNDEFCSVGGVLKNISETGMFIELKDGFLVPNDVVIINELEGYKVAGKVVRRTGNFIGVEICGEHQKTICLRKQVVDPINAEKPVTKHEKCSEVPANLKYLK